MASALEQIPEADRVDEIVRRLASLRPGEVLTFCCTEDPADLAAAVRERSGDAYDRQAIHLARKKTPPWLIHFKRKHRP
jgi:hypothetical protein